MGETRHERDYRQEYKKAENSRTGPTPADIVSDWLRDVGPGEARCAFKQRTPGWEKKRDPRG